MDGGGRLLRSLGGFANPPAYAPLALAGIQDRFAYPAALPQTAPQLPRKRLRRRRVGNGLARIAASRFLGTVLAVGLIGGAAAYGAVRGGQYADFVAANGTIPDLLAKAAGFSINAVTLTGTRELTEAELLNYAGIGPRNSLLFLNVADVRARLKAVPLIKEASVSKLYPHRVLIEVEERQPSALWQKDGTVSIVGADGTPIDDMHDPRFEKLPLVVGADANRNLADYVDILDAAGELRSRIRAGIFVAGRRWTLKTNSGAEILLPDRGAPEAVSRLALLEHDGHILERDILSLDLRVPGRVIARLTEDAAAARADQLDRKAKKKGAAT